MNDGPKKVTAKDGHEYHKSATANATTAPTNEATVANAAKTTGLSAEQAEFVTIIDYEWNLKREISPKAICEEYGYDKTQYDEFAASKLVQEVLTGRGLKPESYYDSAPVGKSKLTPIQLIVANSMLNLTDTRPPKKKLQDAGVTPYQYQAWLKDPDFKAYMVTVSEGLLGDVQHEVLMSLIDKAAGGDMKAIEYYFEMTGRYLRPTNAQTGGNVQDLQQMVIRIIEIVVDEVSDPNEAARIADRLKGLIMGNQIAGTMPAPIITPEIAEPRVMTSEQNAAINRGVGVNE